MCNKCGHRVWGLCPDVSFTRHAELSLSSPLPSGSQCPGGDSCAEAQGGAVAGPSLGRWPSSVATKLHAEKGPLRGPASRSVQMITGVAIIMSSTPAHRQPPARAQWLSCCLQTPSPGLRVFTVQGAELPASLFSYPGRPAAPRKLDYSLSSGRPVGACRRSPSSWAWAWGASSLTAPLPAC